jgi:hypothetical protein
LEQEPEFSSLLLNTQVECRGSKDVHSLVSMANKQE